MKPVRSIDDPRYVKAMSHPLRVRMLALLGERTMSPNELSRVLDVPLGTAAYHVRTLERLGLVRLVKETRVRGAIEHHYRALRAPTVSDKAWQRASPIAKQAAVGSTLQVIDEYARASAAAGGFDGPEAHLTRTMVRVDAQGVEELSRACARLVAEVDAIAAAAAERLESDPHAEGVADMCVAALLFRALRLSDEPPEDAGAAVGSRRARARAW